MAINPNEVQWDSEAIDPNAVQWDTPSPAQPARQDSLGRQLGLTARAVAEGVAGLPMAALEGGAGVGNLISRATGGEGNFSFYPYLERGLDAVFPKPETTTEKVVNVLGSTIAGSKVPGVPAPKTPAPTAADAAIAEGVKRQVPVFYDDVGGTTAKKVGTAAEFLGPMGTGSGRAIQAKAAKAAASELVQDFAPAQGDDVPLMIQKGLERRLKGFRTAVSRLYTKADQSLAGAGPVDVTPVRQAIAQRIVEEEKLGSAANQDLIATLRKFHDAPDGDFAHWRTLRGTLGDEISSYYKGGSAIGDKGVGSLQEAKKALDAALAAHAQKAGGPGYAAWKNADSFYRANIVPFKEAGFRDLVKTAEPEKAWRYLLQNNTDSRAVRMYNGLDRQGRDAVKFGLLKDAYDTATGPKGEFSPARFAKYIEDHDGAVRTFFKGAEGRDIEGFRNLMRHIERAGQYAENPPTGNRLVPILFAGGAVFNPALAAKVGASGLTILGLFQTARGRDFLMRFARMKPGSPEMERAVQDLTRRAAAGSVAVQANDENQ